MRLRLETTHVYIHSTATNDPDQDNIESVKYLHTSPKTEFITWGKYDTCGRAWDDVGYHFLITKNPCEIQIGRDLKYCGAGIKGHNHNSIHIAMSGDNNFTDEQYAMLRVCLDSLYLMYDNLDDKHVKGHRDVVGITKSCPQFDVKLMLTKYPSVFSV